MSRFFKTNIGDTEENLHNNVKFVSHSCMSVSKKKNTNTNKFSHNIKRSCKTV